MNWLLVLWIVVVAKASVAAPVGQPEAGITFNDYVSSDEDFERILRTLKEEASRTSTMPTIGDQDPLRPGPEPGELDDGTPFKSDYFGSDEDFERILDRLREQALWEELASSATMGIVTEQATITPVQPESVQTLPSDDAINQEDIEPEPERQMQEAPEASTLGLDGDQVTLAPTRQPIRTDGWFSEDCVASEEEFQLILERLRAEASGASGSAMGQGRAPDLPDPYAAQPVSRAPFASDIINSDEEFNEVLLRLQDEADKDWITDNPRNFVSDKVEFDTILSMIDKLEESCRQVVDIDEAMIPDEPGAERCAICLENLDSGSIYSTKCNHRFHSDCIDQWKAYSCPPGWYCPICREYQGPPKERCRKCLEREAKQKNTRC